MADKNPLKYENQQHQPFQAGDTVPPSIVNLFDLLVEGDNVEIIDNGNGTVTINSLCEEVGLFNVLPVADFSLTKNDLQVTFTDQSTDQNGVIESWSWDFGDGNSSTAQNPTHTYASAGTYTVMLSVVDDNGGANARQRTITVTEEPGNQPPNADFIVSGAGPLINFTDKSTDSDGTIAVRAWNFGDGNTSSATNPTHTYSAAGTFTVTLTVTDNDGATDTRQRVISVSTGSGGGGGGGGGGGDNPPPPTIVQ